MHMSCKSRPPLPEAFSGAEEFSVLPRLLGSCSLGDAQGSKVTSRGISYLMEKRSDKKHSSCAHHGELVGTAQTTSLSQCPPSEKSTSLPVTLRAFLRKHGFTDVNSSVGLFRHWYPLHAAVAENDDDMVSLLLLHKASTQLRDHSGLTPWEFADQLDRAGSHALVLKLLSDNCMKQFLQDDAEQHCDGSPRELSVVEKELQRLAHELGENHLSLAVRVYDRIAELFEEKDARSNVWNKDQCSNLDVDIVKHLDDYCSRQQLDEDLVRDIIHSLVRTNTPERRATDFQLLRFSRLF